MSLFALTVEKKPKIAQRLSKNPTNVAPRGRGVLEGADLLQQQSRVCTVLVLVLVRYGTTTP
jgi:hypothetical protein